jgi:hypothetical protein
MDPLDPKPLTILVPPGADFDALENALREHAGATVTAVMPENAIDIDGILKRGMAGEERVVLLDPEAVTAALRDLVYPPRAPGAVGVDYPGTPRIATIVGTDRLPSRVLFDMLERERREASTIAHIESLITGIGHTPPPPRESPVLATLAALSSLAGPGAMMPEDRRLFRRPERAPAPPREVQMAAAKKAAERRARKAERNLALVRSGGPAAR